jgi:transcriptional regulator with XRE-family HTH domain
MNLEAERINRGMSRADLAGVLGISAEAVRNIELGARPRPRTAKKIADLYGVKVTDLWPIEDQRDPNGETVAA